MKGFIAICCGFAILFGGGRLIAAIAPKAVCRDGWESPSIGTQGACSHHGGVKKPWTDVLMLPLLGASVGGGVFVLIKLDQWEEYRRRRRQRPRQWAPAIPLCDFCGGLMTEKTLKAGGRRGLAYWECWRAPRCKGRRWVARNDDHA